MQQGKATPWKQLGVSPGLAAQEMLKYDDFVKFVD